MVGAEVLALLFLARRHDLSRPDETRGSEFPVLCSDNRRTLGVIGNYGSRLKNAVEPEVASTMASERLFCTVSTLASEKYTVAFGSPSAQTVLGRYEDEMPKLAEPRSGEHQQISCERSTLLLSVSKDKQASNSREEY